MNIEELHPVGLFPAISERGAWVDLLKRPRVRAFAETVRTEAKRLLAEPIAELPAMGFFDYVRTGDRKKYEDLYFARRLRLELLILAEAFAGEGRFLDGIVDVIWAILNEPTWCLPAHTKLPAEDPLPDFDVEKIGLFSAETSSVLSTVLMLGEAELRAAAPSLVRRMRRTLVERAIVPIETVLDRFWWTDGRNNWTPWICANLVNCANAILADDPARLAAYVRLLQPCMDRYYAQYPEDGGCDEGPSYWAHSPAVAVLYYELLYQMSGGRFSMYGDAKFARMMRYIRDAWVAEDRFFTFSDCPARVRPQGGYAAIFARRTGDAELADFIRRFRRAVPWAIARHRAVVGTLADLFWEDDAEPGPETDRTAYYPELQFLSVRAGRLRLGAVAGHNGMNHNHNDVGQFILAADGEFRVMDPGRPEYTRFTFSERRYESPYINSLYHNVPIFDGVGQAVGREYAARDVSLAREDGRIVFTMDLAPAYPAELELEFCRRTLTLDPAAQTLEVCDTWRARKPHVYSLTLFSPPRESPVEMTASLPVSEEDFTVTDHAQRQDWGDRLKIGKLAAAPAMSGENVLSFAFYPGK